MDLLLSSVSAYFLPTLLHTCVSYTYLQLLSHNTWAAAPTNEALDLLSDGLIENLLLPENVDQLTDILTYHVIAGEALPSSSLSNGAVEMLNGDTATIDLSNGAMINDANIIFPDILASNGIVHVIDKVSRQHL